MFKKILSKVFGGVRRMNDWWDKDKDKDIASVAAVTIFLLAILVLKKSILFIFALILLTNRIIHRFGLWDKLEVSFEVESSYDDTLNDDIIPAEVFESTSEFDKPDSITEPNEETEKDEPEQK